MRKTKLNKRMINEIEKILKKHHSKKTMCQALNIAQNTFYSWLAKADLPNADPLLLELKERVEKASALSKMELQDSILEDKSWLAKRYILENQHPDEFRTKPETEIHVNNAPEPPTINLTLNTKGDN